MRTIRSRTFKVRDDKPLIDPLRDHLLESRSCPKGSCPSISTLRKLLISEGTPLLPTYAETKVKASRDLTAFHQGPLAASLGGAFQPTTLK